MAETVTLEQVESLTAQLPPQEQLKRLARISERLSTLNLLARDADDEAVQHEREAQAILALYDAAAAAFERESDAAEEIRRMRDERIEQICRSAA